MEWRPGPVMRGSITYSKWSVCAHSWGSRWPRERTKVTKGTAAHHGHRVPSPRAHGHGLHLPALEEVVSGAVDLCSRWSVLHPSDGSRSAAHPGGGDDAKRQTGRSGDES